MKEGNFCFQSGKVCNQSHIHCFLHAVACKQCKTGLAASHNVLVIAENVQCMCSQCSCRNVEHARKQFAADFVHVGNHQEQTLACSESACECTCYKTAVYCTCSACFRLHFSNTNGLSEQVLSSDSGPFVGHFCHGRRRSNGVNSCNVTERISNVRGSGVTVNSSLCHYCFFLQILC